MARRNDLNPCGSAAHSVRLCARPREHTGATSDDASNDDVAIRCGWTCPKCGHFAKWISSHKPPAEPPKNFEIKIPAEDHERPSDGGPCKYPGGAWQWRGRDGWVEVFRERFIPLGPEVTTEGGMKMQKGIMSFRIHPPPEIEEPMANSSDENDGWTKEARRDSAKLEESDWDFRALIVSYDEAVVTAKEAEANFKDATKQKEKPSDQHLAALKEKAVATAEVVTKCKSELTAAAWYEYARECGRLRAVAATEFKQRGIGGNCGRRWRYKEGRDKWAKDREKLRATLNARLDPIWDKLKAVLKKMNSKGERAREQKFARRWMDRLNDIEIGYKPFRNRDRPTLHGSRTKFDKLGVDFMTQGAFMRIGWLEQRSKNHAARLREEGREDEAKEFESKRFPRLKKLIERRAAWQNANEWMNKLRVRCSKGAPCLLMLVKWLGDDARWSDIPAEERERAIKEGPGHDDTFDRTGAGKHPIPGLTGGLEMHSGFDTVAPRGVFWNLTGRDGELLSDDRKWTKPLQYKDYRDEVFIGRVVWNRPDNEIIEDFKTWLKRRRDVQPEPWRGMAALPTKTLWDDSRSALKDLAALRLRARLEEQEAGAEWWRLYVAANKDMPAENYEAQAQTRVEPCLARAKVLLCEWALDSAPR